MTHFSRLLSVVYKSTFDLDAGAIATFKSAEDVLQQLHRSVVAVKPDGFVSPVSLS